MGGQISHLGTSLEWSGCQCVLVERAYEQHRSCPTQWACGLGLAELLLNSEAL